MHPDALRHHTAHEKALQVAAPALLAACREFVRKVEAGEAHSVRSYAEMKAALARYEQALKEEAAA